MKDISLAAAGYEGEATQCGSAAEPKRSVARRSPKADEGGG